MRSMDSQSLWFARDHLLIVNGVLTHHYRRMYFRDIEAVSMMPAVFPYAAPIVVLVLLMLFCAWLAWLSLGSMPVGTWVAGGFGLCFLALLITHLIFGPMVNCAIRTRVQTVRVPALRRRKRALRFVERLRGQVESFQEPFLPERFSAFQRHLRQTPPPFNPPPMPSS